MEKEKVDVFLLCFIGLLLANAFGLAIAVVEFTEDTWTVKIPEWSPLFYIIIFAIDMVALSVIVIKHYKDKYEGGANGR